MTDFLEQVIAERRADFPAEEAMSGVERLREGVDNYWTSESHDGIPGRPELWRGFTGASAPFRYGDAFTAVLRARRMDGRLAVIAEVKRVSPALGTLADHVDPVAQAQRYADAGAAAISVLTEPRHWGGSLADLAAVRKAVPHVPVLCKDVIVSIHQIVAARAAGADAVLLIAEALSDDELRRFAQRARELNMGALVEAHEPVAFGRAVACGALVVGANARNLRRPKEIDVSRARELQTFPRDDQIFVAESGIESVDDARLLPARVDAVLVGTALMRADDPAPLIRAISGIRRGSQRTSVSVQP
jgi:indole-3-glycerol phosphate synthase